jgi:hypothetical protein
MMNSKVPFTPIVPLERFDGNHPLLRLAIVIYIILWYHYICMDKYGIGVC